MGFYIVGRFDDREKALDLHEKGIDLCELERYEEAIACFDAAIRLDPRLSDAWNNKGMSLHGLERYEEAIACFDAAIRLDPRH